MKPLSKGDPCRVRLHTGEVVEAEYFDSSEIEKHHIVKVRNRHWLRIGSYNGSRFIGPPCVILPVGASV
jgi:hypothetical protein